MYVWNVYVQFLLEVVRQRLSGVTPVDKVTPHTDDHVVHDCPPPPPSVRPSPVPTTPQMTLPYKKFFPFLQILRINVNLLSTTNFNQFTTTL